MLHFFTSSALNYLPKVGQLVASIRRFHPEAQVHLALADAAEPGLALPVQFDSVIAAETLPVEKTRAWIFGHSIVELATAIKPFVLERLLQSGPPGQVRVIYMDPDTVLYSRLDDVLDALERSSVALTPHLVSAEDTQQGVLDNEMAALKHGIYNLGFVAVRNSPDGLAFASWWRERCKHWCRDDIPNGLFTDQRWVDLAPALFDGVHILRTPRLNVAPWNIGRRTVSERDGRYYVDDEPLGFYHFTGFDSGAHEVMLTRYAGTSGPALALMRNYKQATDLARSDPLSRRPWAFSSFSDGKPIDKQARAAYRDRIDLQRAFADPFDAGGYGRWWLAVGATEYATSSGTRSEGLATAGLRKAGRSRIAEILITPALWKPTVRRLAWIARHEGWGSLFKRI